MVQFISSKLLLLLSYVYITSAQDILPSTLFSSNELTLTAELDLSTNQSHTFFTATRGTQNVVKFSIRSSGRGNWWTVEVERSSSRSRYADFQLDSDRAFIILQLSNLDSDILNEGRIYVNCKPGPRTFIRPPLNKVFQNRAGRVRSYLGVADLAGVKPSDLLGDLEVCDAFRKRSSLIQITTTTTPRPTTPTTKLTTPVLTYPEDSQRGRSGGREFSNKIPTNEMEEMEDKLDKILILIKDLQDAVDENKRLIQENGECCQQVGESCQMCLPDFVDFDGDDGLDPGFGGLRGIRRGKLRGRSTPKPADLSEPPLCITCAADPCYEGVECTNLPHGYQCGSCPSGMTGNGEECEFTVTCADDPCFPTVTCTDTSTGFECGPCPDGFSGNGISCQSDLTCRDDPCFPRK